MGIAPSNPAPLPPSYLATQSGARSIYPGTWASQFTGSPPVDTTPPWPLPVTGPRAPKPWRDPGVLPPWTAPSLPFSHRPARPGA